MLSPPLEAQTHTSWFLGCQETTPKLMGFFHQSSFISLSNRIHIFVTFAEDRQSVSASPQCNIREQGNRGVGRALKNHNGDIDQVIGFLHWFSRLCYSRLLFLFRGQQIPSFVLRNDNGMFERQHLLKASVVRSSLQVLKWLLAAIQSESACSPPAIESPCCSCWPKAPNLLQTRTAPRDRVFWAFLFDEKAVIFYKLSGLPRLGGVQQSAVTRDGFK